MRYWLQIEELFLWCHMVRRVRRSGTCWEHYSACMSEQSARHPDLKRVSWSPWWSNDFSSVIETHLLIRGLLRRSLTLQRRNCIGHTGETTPDAWRRYCEYSFFVVAQDDFLLPFLEVFTLILIPLRNSSPSSACSTLQHSVLDDHTCSFRKNDAVTLDPKAGIKEPEVLLQAAVNPWVKDIFKEWARGLQIWDTKHGLTTYRLWWLYLWIHHTTTSHFDQAEMQERHLNDTSIVF